MDKTRYIGHSFQLSGVEEYVLNKGKGKGCLILHVKNGLGLEMCINADRGFDITSLTFKGENLSYMSPCGYVSSKYYDNRGLGFLKSFTAGFLTTCGLTQAGSPNIDDGEELPLHGTYSHIPCSNFYYDENDKEIVLFGEVHDEVIFAHKLVLKRKIIVSKIINNFKIIDEIINKGDTVTPFEILYHINLGYPLLDENTSVSINSSLVRPRNEHSKTGIDKWKEVSKPIDNFEEMCFYHTFEDSTGKAEVYNKLIHKGVRIQFDSSSLKYLTQWKMMGVRDYVLGIEPGNCFPDGRSEAKKNNELEYLKPNESKTKELVIDVFEK